MHDDFTCDGAFRNVGKGVYDIYEDVRKIIENIGTRIYHFLFSCDSQVPIVQLDIRAEECAQLGDVMTVRRGKVYCCLCDKVRLA